MQGLIGEDDVQRQVVAGVLRAHEQRIAQQRAAFERIVGEVASRSGSDPVEPNRFNGGPLSGQHVEEIGK
jgi:hypothetical protein